MSGFGLIIIDGTSEAKYQVAIEKGWKITCFNKAAPLTTAFVFVTAAFLTSII